MEGFCFEIMKNCSGTLVTPNVPSGRKIDSKLLLKSIAPTGCIYIRLLAELDDESDEMLEHSVFSIPENQAEASFTATTSTSSFTTTLSSSSSSTMTLPSSSSRSSSTVSSSIITPSSTNTTVATVDLTVATSHNSAGTSEESVDLLNATASNREEHPIQCPFDINAIISDAKTQVSNKKVLRSPLPERKNPWCVQGSHLLPIVVVMCCIFREQPMRFSCLLSRSCLTFMILHSHHLSLVKFKALR